MNLPISELRNQRDLVKRHLDWIDARLAEADAAAPATAHAAPPTENPAPGDSGTTDAAVADTTAAAPHPGEAAAEVIIASYAEEQQGLSPNAKAGCVIAAAVAVLLFLFMLFGLPYLLYGKKTGEPAAPPETEQP